MYGVNRPPRPWLLHEPSGPFPPVGNGALSSWAAVDETHGICRPSPLRVFMHGMSIPDGGLGHSSFWRRIAAQSLSSCACALSMQPWHASTPAERPKVPHVYVSFPVLQTRQLPRCTIAAYEPNNSNSGALHMAQ
eukprot:361730-Chlamydomonas_euryale.AAC.1